MKIGLYFGSFNPIHLGHLLIASYVVEEKLADKVWFVVSPQNPFKKASTLLNEYDRLHLVNLAIENDARFKASDIEFKLPKPSYTIDTLTYLKEKYPSLEFSIILGADSYQNIHKWKNGDQILNNNDILVYNRIGSEAIKPEANNHQFLKAPILEISSTEIRNFIKQKRSIKYMLPEKVENEILLNNYYR